MPAARLLVRLTLVFALIWCAAVIAVHAQNPAALATPASTAETQKVEVIADPLGRHTPRGTVTGFLEAARKGDLERAAQYPEFQGAVRRGSRSPIVRCARCPPAGAADAHQ